MIHNVRNNNGYQKEERVFEIIDEIDEEVRENRYKERLETIKERNLLT